MGAESRSGCAGAPRVRAFVHRRFGSVRQASAGILSCCSTAFAGALPMDSTMCKTALRMLARDQSYALLNISGLALAIVLDTYVTVAMQLLKAARPHAARALRYE